MKCHQVCKSLSTVPSLSQLLNQQMLVPSLFLGKALTAFKSCQQSTRPQQSKNASSLNYRLVWKETDSSSASAAAGSGQERGDTGSLDMPWRSASSQHALGGCHIGAIQIQESKNAFSMPFYLKKLDFRRAKQGDSNKANSVFPITLALLQKDHIPY